MYDIVIIGAGVVGAMTARALSKYDLNICLLEKENDVAKGATRANSAIVHAGFDAQEGTLKAELNVKGSELMEQVCTELGVKYIRNGSLVIGFSEEDRSTLDELCKRGITNGVKGVRVIERAELKVLEPNISDNALCALYAPTGAIVCPYELCIAAVGNAIDNGVRLMRNFEVNNIIRSSDRFTVVSSDCRSVEARYVINAAGVYADKIAEMSGDSSFDIHPRRGEYILLDRECGETVKHTIFRTPSKMGKGILITPTVDGNLLVGPTSVDITDRADNSTTSDGLSLVIRQANENIQGGVPFGKSITSFCGLRAVGSTGDFIINIKDRFVNLAGIESPGLSSAPAIAEYVADILKNDGLTLEARQNFIPTRKPAHFFRELSIEEKNDVIKKDPSFGRIICRCESITEGEILDAIRTEPKAVDIDGVKRRTRAGMGRCQGGFCGTYVMELIAKENAIPLENVTKSGGSSYMVTGRTK